MHEEAKAGGRYRNKKTGNIYVVLHSAFASWDSYQREDKDADGRIWVRAFSEFYEKFESLD